MTRLLWLSFGEWRGYWFTNLGVHTLAAHIDRWSPKHIEQGVWYYDEGEIDWIVSCVAESFPDFICCSVNVGFLDRCLAVLKRMGSDVMAATTLVFGNRDFLTAANVEKALRAYPQAYVVRAEGEEALTAILSDTPIEAVPNLFYSRSGQVQFTFDSVLRTSAYAAPTYSIGVLNQQALCLNETVAYVETSRGCSKRRPCTYCANCLLRTQRSWRMLDLREIMNSTVGAAHGNPVAINFVAEDFLGSGASDVVRLLELLEAARQSGTVGCQTSFYCAIRAEDVVSANGQSDNATKRETLKRMKSLGFETVYIGFESGSDPQLARYGKDITAAENLECTRIIKALGLNIDGGFIPFDPLMSLEDCLSNLAFLGAADIPKLFLFPFNRLHVYAGSGYARLLKSRRQDPLAVRLLASVERADQHLPYDLLELFLQRLRLGYFGRGDGVEDMESICRRIGRISSEYLEATVNALAHDCGDAVVEDLVELFARRTRLVIAEMEAFLMTDWPSAYCHMSHRRVSI